MNTHEFFNLLDGRISIPRLRNGIWKYSPSLLIRHKLAAAWLRLLARLVLVALSYMTYLEKKQFQYTAGGKIQAKVDEYKRQEGLL